MPPPPSPESLERTLLDSLLADQRRRWREGRPPALEDYLRQHPALAEQPDAVIELIYNEVLLREQRGETPRPEDYLPRFPTLAEELALQFQAHRLLPGSQIDTRPDGPPPAAAPPGLPHVGGYEVLGKIGEGGMGAVYKARHLALDRLVALKVLPGSALDEPELRERFQREARAVARLHQENPHPNVVQVFEVGTAPAPFFSMELVEGGSLEQRLHGGTLAPGEAARVVELLARAMQHTHQRGIVHRDLKPANVLLAGAGLVPRITDFGLAKRLDVEQGKTREGMVLGTAPYMAPEQARGRNQEVGPASDVYALGAILYECLTGRPPFKAATTWETILQVIQDDPVPPRQLQPKVPRDLEAVCLKCLEKDPARRYRSAEALAEDLARFLRGEPTEARPVGWPGRAARWVRRRPLVAGLVAAVVLALVGGTVVSAAFAVQAGHKARDEARAREDAEEQKTNAETARDNEKHAREDAELAQDGAEHQDYLHRIALARSEWLAGNVRRAEEVLDTCPPKRRGWEWSYCKRLCHADLPPPMKGMTFHGGVGVAFNRRGQLATADPFGKVAVWTKVEINKRVLWWPKEFSFHTPRLGSGSVETLALSPDGRYVAAINQPLGQGFIRPRPEVKVWEVQTGKEITPAVLAYSRARGLAFHPDGNRLAVAGENGVRVYDLARGRLVSSFPKHADWVEAVAYSPDGTRIASGSADGSVRVWDAVTGADEYVFERQGRVMSVAFRPDGELLAAAGKDGHVKVWEVWSNRRRYRLLRLQVAYLVGSLPSGLLPALPLLGLEPRTPRPDPYLAQHHEDMVRGLAFSPNGLSLASAGNDRLVKVFDLDTGATRTFRGHRDLALGVAFSPDGKLLASAERGEVKFWDASAAEDCRVLRGHDHHVHQVACSPDGRLVASTSDDRTVKVWEARTGKAVCTFRGHRTATVGVAFSPDGKYVASGSRNFRDVRGVGEILVWEARTGTIVRSLRGHVSLVLGLAFSPDGRLLASSGRDDVLGKKPGEVIVWDARTGKERFTLRGYQGAVGRVTFSPDSKLLASATDGGTVKLHDTDTGREVRTLRGAGTGVAFSRDGAWLAVGGGDRYEGGRITVYDAASGRVVCTLRGHSRRVSGVAFTRDGKRLASCGHDGAVKIWDTATRAEVLSLPHPGFVNNVVFSPDDQFLASAGGPNLVRGEVRIWDATPWPGKKGPAR